MAPPPDYSAQGYKEIKAQLDDIGVLLITLDRAKQKNTFSNLLAHELIQIFTLADRDDRVRVVVTTAEHTAPAFCAGADISAGWSQLKREDDPDVHSRELAHRDSGGKVSLAIYNCRKLTISAVNGHAAGVGMTAMQLPFDIRFVWQGAKLVFPFIRRGIVPEAAATYLLPRLLGHSRANSLLLTGGTFSPSSPLISSLYHAILPTREEVLPAALELAKEVAVYGAPVSVMYTKGLLQHGGDSIEENHILDSRALGILGGSEDAAEGARCFFEKRAPKWKGVASEDSWYPWWKTVDVRPRKSKL